ncbi:MAG TPA: cytochrome P450 [Stellaceae bacterium]|jgi:cytochrome P450
MIEAQPLVGPAPGAATDTPSSRGFTRSMRTNAISIFPPEAFEQDVVFRKLFGRRQIIISRPAAIEHILVDNPENYRRTAAGIRILRPLLGRGLLLSTGEDWRHQRRTLAPAFAPRTMPILAAHVARAAGAAAVRIEECCAAPVDLLAAMQFLALEIAGASMFSLEMERYGVELRGLIKAYAGHLGRPSLLDFLLPPSLPSPRDVARWCFRRRWLGLIRRIIAARREQGSAGAPRDLFDLLSTARDPESGALFPPKRLADQVATMIVAGHETTAVALFWSLYLLATAPAAQQRIAAEVAHLDLGPDNAAAIVPRLAYTRAVVHEALRLYPPAFTLARQAIGADAAGGIPIPARTTVLISPWVLHRHRLLWTEPETFDPSRFLPPAPPPGRFAYLPFGIGPRVCIGAQFALTEATLVLATMIQTFHVERADDTPVAPRAVVTTQPDHPPPFLLRPRHEPP